MCTKDSRCVCCGCHLTMSGFILVLHSLLYSPLFPLGKELGLKASQQRAKEIGFSTSAIKLFSYESKRALEII